MKIHYLPWERQPEELLIYLGVRKGSVGWPYLLACFLEIAGGYAPGIEVYERVALTHGSTVAQTVKCCQRALVKAQQRRPREWEEIVPGLDMEWAGLSLFLYRAAAWLDHNRIVYFRLGRVKHRMPAPRGRKTSAEAGKMLDKSEFSDIII